MTRSLCLPNYDICVCQAAKYVRQSYDTLVDIFESIGNFVSRLKIYSEIKSTPAMIETMIKLMAEMMAVLGLMTKQVNQGRLSTPSSTFSDGNRWFDSAQRNSQQSYWERKTSNQFFSASIDSPETSPG